MGEIINIDELKIRLENEIKLELKRLDTKNKFISFLIFTKRHDAILFLKGLNELFDSFSLNYKNFNFYDMDEKEIINEIEKLNNDKNAMGILPIRPLREDLNEFNVFSSIDPNKDIDCLTYINLGKLFSFKPKFIPSVVLASFEILKDFVLKKFNDLNYLTGKLAVIVGRSIGVGRPLYIISLMNNLVPLNLHSKVKNLKDFLILGDIIFACAGVPELIKKDMIKENSIIIDIGINKRADGKIVGDVDLNSVLEKCLGITPVPHGVSKITNLILIKNYLMSFKFI
ncbi:MAG: bifunctional 5,10-methylenetetrahydrofolate dehydrogenase/5,10-methenyltetrahydrofolate cyclohydrolase [Caldisericia bacterium]|jgi:methylenetetrahydrofolate dehydrogenase (NADP+)/methenyltetrahydrofolate cyclohydrolase|nr:bifunctional 5,10-methylenetetrahydrofolate dehydrogenase/5,10-methenyltetrahydrofolate cyclohydrolase [Caldisericia bacterium]